MLWVLIGWQFALSEYVSDTEIARTIATVWPIRDDRYSEIRSSETLLLPKIEMSYIGG